jgi:LPXTG-site transpeptidase (sortase) family protein
VRGIRRVSRRSFVALAAASLVAAGCQKEQIVYVEQPTATPLPPAPTTGPTFAPTVAPTIIAKPEAKPAMKPQGLIPMPVPAAPAAPILNAQAQVIPPIQPRTRPYVNRLQVPERLQIPTIDLDSKVVSVGTKTDQQGHILWETAPFAVGHHKGSGLPGETGNVVLSGHISSPREGNVFNKLPKVEPGDGVIIGTADRQYLYVVVETKVVTPDAVEVLDSTDQAIVTMLTCVPDGVYSHRLVVRAEAV